MTAASALTGQKSGMTYDSYDNLTSYRRAGAENDDDHKYKMTYGSSATEKKKHLIKTSETPEEVRHTYTYDAESSDEDCKGVLTKDKLGTSSLSITAQTGYTANKNYAISQTDARGETVSKTIDANTGLVYTIEDPKQNTVNYEYDASHRVTQVEVVISGSGETAAKARNEYTYEYDRIKTVRHNTTTNDTDVVYTFSYDSFGAQTGVTVGNGAAGGTQYTLSTNVYSNDQKHLLQEVQYGNGGKVSYSYDTFDRITGLKYDSATDERYSYTYGANGQLARVTDHALRRSIWTEYDCAQRPIRTTLRDDINNALLYRTVLKYNKQSSLIRFKEQVGSAVHTTDYNYDRDDRTKKIAYRTTTGTGGYGIEYTYDAVGRVSSVKRGAASIDTDDDTTIAVTPNTALATSYTYIPGSSEYGTGASSPLVSTITHGTGANQIIYTYTYDECGNITSETRGSNTTTYVYDKLGELIRVNDPNDPTSGHEDGTTWVYTYDRGGNMLSKAEYAYTTDTDPGTAIETTSYTYGDSVWKDKLTEYRKTTSTGIEDTTLTYDAIGNLTNDGTWTYTWQAGRQLVSMSNGSKTVQFAYDHSGLRKQKSVTENNVTTTTEYTYHGKLLTGLTQGSDVLHFYYDKDSRPQMVDYNGTMYYYVHNLQGDIIAIEDTTGTIKVEYKYDSWGAPQNPTGDLAASLGTINPFRYRGYV